ncbi:heavy metal translocating P-type ATPase [Candidatus Berkelbacteria bacterium]|nr:heavy metal translocating P-type ATPase [Candidatus Berkelbacteria bacterium]
MFRDRFWITLALTIPILAYSPIIQTWFGLHAPQFTGSQWLPLTLGTIIFFYGGSVFLKSALAELKAKLPGMMTLISMAIIAAYSYSVATTFFIQGSEFFWELATLITVMLFGHWMEMRSVSNAQGALRELAKLLPDTAELIKKNMTEKIPVSQLHAGDMVLVRPGTKVPVDGQVVKGQSSINEAMITGESRPVEKTVASQVIAGTVNGAGALTIKVTGVGEHTALAGIMRLVAEAQASRSRAQILADRAAFYLTVIALVTGGVTLVSWFTAGAGLQFAVERAVTVLVIACPHALGLAVPLVTAISTSLAARNGLLIRERMALENARSVDVVLFDKTGTLTKGEQGVVDIWPLRGYTKTSLLKLAAGAEASSEHMIGKAIVHAARQRKITVPNAEQFQSLAGKGVRVLISGNTIFVGGPQLIKDRNVTIPQVLEKNLKKAARQGKAVIYIIKQKEIIGALSISDIIRRESKQVITSLHAMGVRVAMITGDAKDVATAVARELGIRQYFAEVLPQHKVDTVKALQQDGSKVAMVGDGVNDAPALVQADVGIAIGAGTDVAIESAGIILVKNDPRDVLKIIQLSKSTYRKMIQNLLWATGYNVIAIPLAAGIFARWGILLPPAIGGLLMSASTIIVALNAQLLKRLTLG